MADRPVLHKIAHTWWDHAPGQLVDTALAPLPAEVRPHLRRLLHRLQRHDAGGTYAHSVGVAGYAGRCARRMGLASGTVNRIVTIGLLHDIGKVLVSPDILNKTSALDPTERRVIQLHPVHGEQLLPLFPGLDEIAAGIRSHHERWDGCGYPDCLEREAIPLSARVITVADAFDAMTRDRSYRPKMPVTSAVGELRQHAGRMFDPDVVAAFLDDLAQPPAEAVRFAREALGPVAHQPNLRREHA